MTCDSLFREPLAPRAHDNLVGMVAYEDLVVALTNWRINQGLPTGADAFAAFETGSVDLALPVVDPVELNTGEVLAIDDDAGIEEVLEEDGSFEEVVAADPGTEPESLASFADDEVVMESVNLDYGEETAYGEMPDMNEMAEPPALEAVEASEAPQDDVVLEAEPVEEAPIEEAPIEEAPIEEAVEEVALDAASEEFAADEMDIAEEVDADGFEAVEEVAVADEGADVALGLEEDVNAEGFEAVEVDADDFEADEIPTKFGDDHESEATVMGIGVEEFVPPDEEA